MSSRFVTILIKLAFVFEPLTPRFVSFFLSRRLLGWKKKRLIYDYETRTERIGKFHYRIDMSLDLTPRQARGILRNLMLKILDGSRR